jgi:hypothetical protein
LFFFILFQLPLSPFVIISNLYLFLLNNNNIYFLPPGDNPVAVVILHVYKYGKKKSN